MSELSAEMRAWAHEPDTCQADALLLKGADALDAQAAEIVRLTEDVETWRVEASTSRRDMKKLAQDLDEYQVNVSESLDRTTAYEAEIKADRDNWRRLCQEGWVEVADGPVSRKLREDLATWIMQHSFATGHGDSHTDLLGELGPQIDALRARAEAAERDAERYRWLREPAISSVSGATTSNLMMYALHGGKFRSTLDALDAEIDAARGGA